MDVRRAIAEDRWTLNNTVYQPGQRAGHYESFYQRANHPIRPLAFWLRYTIFVPIDEPSAAIGELWAVAFDGETHEHAVAKVEVPFTECEFDRETFAVRVGSAQLDRHGLTGAAGDLEWDLRYSGDSPPLLLLPPQLYERSIPKAKSLVTLPSAVFSGSYSVRGQRVNVDGWVGSQNHNWGSEHTHRYAFGQVAGFDGHPDSFLEVATVKSRVAGPLVTPWMTTLVLRHGGREHSLVSLGRAIRATASYTQVPTASPTFDWTFTTRDDQVEISGAIRADRDAFVGLKYRNPPGGTKYCLNTKIAAATITVRDRRAATIETLSASDRALFEILTDSPDSGVEIRA